MIPKLLILKIYFMRNIVNPNLSSTALQDKGSSTLSILPSPLIHLRTHPFSQPHSQIHLIQLWPGWCRDPCGESAVTEHNTRALWKTRTVLTGYPASTTQAPGGGPLQAAHATRTTLYTTLLPPHFMDTLKKFHCLTPLLRVLPLYKQTSCKWIRPYRRSLFYHVRRPTVI